LTIVGIYIWWQESRAITERQEIIHFFINILLIVAERGLAKKAGSVGLFHIRFFIKEVSWLIVFDACILIGYWQIS